MDWLENTEFMCEMYTLYTLGVTYYCFLILFFLYILNKQNITVHKVGTR